LAAEKVSERYRVEIMGTMRGGDQDEKTPRPYRHL
jgi:hypothetical protein